MAAIFYNLNFWYDLSECFLKLEILMFYVDQNVSSILEFC